MLTASVVKAGRWGGVVTAFITMSDIKDEIDWEFPGDAVTQGQTNYFWQGVIREPRGISPSAACADRQSPCSGADTWYDR